jgi:hypothetical protein
MQIEVGGRHMRAGIGAAIQVAMTTIQSLDADALLTVCGGADADDRAKRLISDANKIDNDAFSACFRAGGTFQKCSELGTAVGNLTKIGTVDALLDAADKLRR